MPKFKVFVVGEDEKCGGCNWRVSKTYLMAKSQEEANKEYQDSGAEDGEPRGLCGECFVAMLIEAGYQIDTDKPQ